MIQAIMEFTDTIIYPAFEAEWVGRDMPEPIIYLLEFGNVVLPPYILAICCDRHDINLSKAKADLEHVKLFEDEALCDWFLAHGNKYPATATYICQLDLVRRCCLEILTKHT